jgi:hypothetical protein
MDASSLNMYLKRILRGTGTFNFYVISRNCFDSVSFCAPKTVIIVNTSDSYPGEHWVAFYVYRSPSGLKGEYFDSFAQPLSTYKITVPFNITLKNEKIVQSVDSATCGLHCLYFIYHRVRRHSLKMMLSQYVNKPSINDRIVLQFQQKICKL